MTQWGRPPSLGCSLPRLDFVSFHHCVRDWENRPLALIHLCEAPQFASGTYNPFHSLGDGDSGAKSSKRCVLGGVQEGRWPQGYSEGLWCALRECRAGDLPRGDPQL